jgi:hypothetical protein
MDELRPWIEEFCSENAFVVEFSDDGQIVTTMD